MADTFVNLTGAGTLYKDLRQRAARAGGNMAPEFSTASKYAVGDFCMYKDILYRCTTAITTAGAWDSSKWTSVKTMSEVANIQEDVSDLKSAITDKADVIVNTASGAIASFSDGADDLPVKSLSVAIEPVQDLHGYENPWPGGGWKNLYNSATFPSVTRSGITCTNNGDGSFTFNGTATADVFFDVFSKQFNLNSGGTPLPSAEYRLTGCPSGGSVSTYYLYTTPQYHNDRGSGNTFTDEINGGSIFIKSGYTANNLTFKPMIRLASNGDDTFAPYSNICPISGWTGTNVCRTGKNLFTKSPIRIIQQAWVNQSTKKIETNYYLDLWVYQIPKGALYVQKPNDGSEFYNGFANSPDLNKNDYVDEPWFFRWGPSHSYQNTKYNYVYMSVATGVEMYLTSMTTDSSDTLLPLGTGQRTPISWQSEAGTVYGGSLDVTTGEMVVDRTCYTIPTSTIYKPGNSWCYSDAFRTEFGMTKNFTPIACNQFKVGLYSALTGSTPIIAIENGGYLYIGWDRINEVIGDTQAKSRQYFTDNPLAVLFTLKEAIVYHLTPVEVCTILGQNCIWADTGDIENVSYRADTKLYIDNKIAQAVAAALNA